MEVHEESRIYTRYTFYQLDIDIIILQISGLVGLATPVVTMVTVKVYEAACQKYNRRATDLSYCTPK